MLFEFNVIHCKINISFFSFRVRVEDMVLTYAGPLEFMNSLDWNVDDAHLSTTYQVNVTVSFHSIKSRLHNRVP